MQDINIYCQKIKNPDQILDNQYVYKREHLPIKILNSLEQIAKLIHFIAL